MSLCSAIGISPVLSLCLHTKRGGGDSLQGIVSLTHPSPVSPLCRRECRNVRRTSTNCKDGLCFTEKVTLKKSWAGHHQKTFTILVCSLRQIICPLKVSRSIPLKNKQDEAELSQGSLPVPNILIP